MPRDRKSIRRKTDGQVRSSNGSGGNDQATTRRLSSYQTGRRRRRRRRRRLETTVPVPDAAVDDVGWQQFAGGCDAVLVSANRRNRSFSVVVALPIGGSWNDVSGGRAAVASIVRERVERYALIEGARPLSGVTSVGPAPERRPVRRALAPDGRLRRTRWRGTITPCVHFYLRWRGSRRAPDRPPACVFEFVDVVYSA